MRAVENLIKAGAMDGLDGNRHQMITVFPSIMDRISSDKKSSMAGQMTLFDIASDDIKEEFEIKMPDLEEYDKEEFLALEKEVLGVYISGHPLEKYTELLKKNVTAGCRDFMLDEETHKVTVVDGAMVIIGGMITDKTHQIYQKQPDHGFYHHRRPLGQCGSDRLCQRIRKIPKSSGSGQQGPDQGTCPGRGRKECKTDLYGNAWI